LKPKTLRTRAVNAPASRIAGAGSIPRGKIQRARLTQQRQLPAACGSRHLDLPNPRQTRSDEHRKQPLQQSLLALSSLNFFLSGMPAHLGPSLPLT
jgi:hypothetical protein